MAVVKYKVGAFRRAQWATPLRRLALNNVFLVFSFLLLYFEYDFHNKYNSHENSSL